MSFILYIVNEEEITQGIFNCPNDVNQSCVWFKRQFTDLYDQRPSSDSSLSLYSDVSLGRRGIMEFDSEAVKLLNYLKEARMPARYIGLVCMVYIGSTILVYVYIRLFTYCLLPVDLIRRTYSIFQLNGIRTKDFPQMKMENIFHIS